MAEKSKDPVIIQQPQRNKRPKLSTFISIFLALSTIYSIITLISIEKKYQTARVKSHEDWDALIRDHPYHPRTETDARSPCPALNTLANHGFIPRDGRNITFDTIFDAVVKVGLNPFASQAILAFAYSQFKTVSPNDSSFFSQFEPLHHLDLNRLTIYGVLEHDVSLTRNDSALISVPNATTAQMTPAYIERMIRIAEDGVFTSQNEHDIRKIRWLESLRDNPYLHLRLFDQAAIAAECSLLMELLGRNGKISTSHLRSFLLEERIPDDWYPYELSLFSFGKSFFKCWYGVRNSKASI